MTRYFIFAGEASGDLHGSRLIRNILQKDQHSTFQGVGGHRMRKEAFECFLPTEHFQVMGFSDVICSLPRLLKLFYQVRNKILQDKPDAVIFIDYPGFNLRLIKSLRTKGYQGKIIQYICPSVWAHGKKRIQILERYADLLLCIYPFEPAYFSKEALQVAYVGNPLQELLQFDKEMPSTRQSELPSDSNLIALFPGSRLSEIEYHIPLQLQAAMQLKIKYPELIFAISCAQPSLLEKISSLVKETKFCLNRDLFIIPSQFCHELMNNCLFAVAKSGTVTLELALREIPTIVHYHISFFNRLIAKYLLRLNLPYYCIVNILGKKTIFPEFIGKNLSAKSLSEQMESFYTSNERKNEIKSGCRYIKDLLESQSDRNEATSLILGLFS